MSKNCHPTRTARISQGCPISDDTSRALTRFPLEQGAQKDLSGVNLGTPTLPASQRQRILRWHMLHKPHIFTRHCKAFIWVWVSGACEGSALSAPGQNSDAVRVS